MSSQERGAEWFADKDFWRDFGPLMFDAGRMRRTPRDVDLVAERLGVEPGRLLDLCCGPGRHALELARRGFRVTGVDLDAAFLAQGRAAADAENLDVELVEMDARAFTRSEAFDAAICMYTSFGYFEDLYDDRLVLANLHASLRPGGRLLLETMGKESVALSFRSRNWYYPNDFPDDIFMLENRIVGAWERLEMHWKIIRADNTKSEAVLSVRLFSALEITSLLHDAGFRDIEVFGHLDGSPYAEGASILVATATR